jgi:hypothetical protein
MNFFQRLVRLLSRSSDTSIDKMVKENKPPVTIDKVANFNKVAPQLFITRLKEYGYELTNIENFEHSGFLWSTHHYYQNKALQLTIDIQQAPYYTDYGFSIFLLKSEQQYPKLLCHVPHELQDKEDLFLASICELFFSNPEIISLLKGNTSNVIHPIRLQ